MDDCDNPGGGVEGELHSNWGQLQLLDGVRLEMRMFSIDMTGHALVSNLVFFLKKSGLGDVNIPDREHHWWDHQQEHGSGQ